MPSDELDQLRSKMALAHPIHPRTVFAMELRAERTKGKAEEFAITEQKIALEKSTTIQHMLDKGCDWAFITAITGVAEADFPALLQKAEGAGKQP